MPLVYRSSSLDPEPPEPPLRPTDADDSIVLSDLVRTGETSRLRRRGAMRLDYNHRASNPAGRRGEPYVVLPSSPPWGESAESDEEVVRRDSDSAESAATLMYEQDESEREDARVYTLYCGADEGWEFEDHGEGASSSSSYVPSPFPAYPPTNHKRQDPAARKSNGCGSIIHTHAVPHRRCGVWTAKSEASDIVVPVDESYFDKRTRSLMIMGSRCGCIREGIGCAVCGNILGTRYRACTGAEGFFSSPARHTDTLRPEGTNYYNPQPSSSSRSPQSPSPPIFVYTFFSANVTASPAYDIPLRSPPPLSESPETIYVPPQPIISDYLIPPRPGYVTPPNGNSYIRLPPPHELQMSSIALRPESPSVSADEDIGDTAAMASRLQQVRAGDAEEDDQNQDQEGYDSDGDLIVDQPSSPDKSTVDLPLWSGR